MFIIATWMIEYKNKKIPLSLSAIRRIAEITEYNRKTVIKTITKINKELENRGQDLLTTISQWNYREVYQDDAQGHCEHDLSKIQKGKTK